MRLLYELFGILFLSCLTTRLEDTYLEIIVVLYVFLEILPLYDYCKNSLLYVKPDILHDQFITIVYGEHVRKDIVTAIGINQINQYGAVVQNVFCNLRELELLIYIATRLALGS